MENSFRNKTVLITGASGGIGKAIAKTLSDAGCRLVLCCNENKIESADALIFQGDLSDEAVVADLFGKMKDNNCMPDAVVNNAGISLTGLFTLQEEKDWNRLFDVNVKATFLVSKYAAKEMIKNHSGAIVNISSMWGEVGASCEVAYSATKGAIIAFTKALAKELGPSGIRVNCVSPGVIDTEMNAHLSEEDMKELADETPLGRIGSPEDVASAVKFLLSDDASFITGQVLGVNGGFVI